MTVPASGPQTPEYILHHCPVHTPLGCQTWLQKLHQGEAVGLPPRPGENVGLRQSDGSLMPTLCTSPLLTLRLFLDTVSTQALGSMNALSCTHAHTHICMNARTHPHIHTHTHHGWDQVWIWILKTGGISDSKMCLKVNLTFWKISDSWNLAVAWKVPSIMRARMHAQSIWTVTNPCPCMPSWWQALSDKSRGWSQIFFNTVRATRGDFFDINNWNGAQNKRNLSTIQWNQLFHF